MARTRYRDWDGKNRLVQATASSRSTAERKLKQKLAERSLYQPGFNGMSADSPFPKLVAYWLEDMEIEDRLSRTTRNLYERDMRTLVLPTFKELTLREIGVARCDYFLKQLARRSYSRAKHARVVLRLALALAVRHEILPRNPMDHVSRLHRKKTVPDAFTIDEVQDIRAAIKAWESRRILSGPRPDRQLGQIVEVMLGTSARIGEVLAIRVQDLHLDGPIPTHGSLERSSAARANRRTGRIIRRRIARFDELRCRRSRCRRSGHAYCVAAAPSQTRCCSAPEWGHRTRQTTSAGSCVT